MWRVGCAAIIALLASGCCGNDKKKVEITTVSSCGTFSFSGADHGNHGIHCTIGFAFDPARCQADPCTCNTICYIQMMRCTRHSDGAILQPLSEQAERVVTGQSDERYNGWAIDRFINMDWGYYGREDDGTFNHQMITLGSNAAPAMLFDSPHSWDPGSTFEAVSVAVCIDPSSGCVNHLLGYQYWQFIVQADGVVPNPSSSEASDWMPAALDLAVNEWNHDAPALGKNQFPALSRMP